MIENSCESVGHEVAEKLLKSPKNRNRIVLAGCIALVIGSLGATAFFCYFVFKKMEVSVGISN